MQTYVKRLLSWVTEYLRLTTLHSRRHNSLRNQEQRKSGAWDWSQTHGVVIVNSTVLVT